MAENPIGLELGTEAPDFSSINVGTGDVFSLLKTVKMHKGVLLNFHRGNW